jgi:hypothetical protein
MGAGAAPAVKAAYQAKYRLLFALVVSGRQESEEAGRLFREMDGLPGTRDEKTAWGLEVGWQLYGRLYYG